MNETINVAKQVARLRADLDELCSRSLQPWENRFPGDPDNDYVRRGFYDLLEPHERDNEPVIVWRETDDEGRALDGARWIVYAPLLERHPFEGADRARALMSEILEHSAEAAMARVDAVLADCGFFLFTDGDMVAARALAGSV